MKNCAAQLIILISGLLLFSQARADDDATSFSKRILRCAIPFGRLASSEPKAVTAAKARADARASERLQLDFYDTAPNSNDDFVPASAEEIQALYGKFDPAKVKKASEVAKKSVVDQPHTQHGRWYRSIVELGGGRVESINYVIVETKPSGNVLIRFENPIHRGKIETREMRPAELRRGLKELDAPPPGAAF